MSAQSSTKTKLEQMRMEIKKNKQLQSKEQQIKPTQIIKQKSNQLQLSLTPQNKQNNKIAQSQVIYNNSLLQDKNQIGLRNNSEPITQKNQKNQFQINQKKDSPHIHSNQEENLTIKQTKDKKDNQENQENQKNVKQPILQESLVEGLPKALVVQVQNSVEAHNRSVDLYQQNKRSRKAEKIVLKEVQLIKRSTKNLNSAIKGLLFIKNQINNQNLNKNKVIQAMKKIAQCLK